LEKRKERYLHDVSDYLWQVFEKLEEGPWFDTT